MPVSHEAPFPTTSDRRSWVAKNGTYWEVITIELSVGVKLFLNFLTFTTGKKTVPKSEKDFIISLSRDCGKMSGENTHNECNFWGHESPSGLEWPKNLHEWWVFPTNFQKSQSREWYLFHNDVFPNSCEENEWGKQSLEWGKYCQNDTKQVPYKV